jgi:hypothetical protein
LSCAADLAFDIVVAAANSPPSFTISQPRIEVDEDSGLDNWHEVQVASDIYADGRPGATEAEQELSFLVTVASGAHLFSALPAISQQGVLSFRLAADAYGSATLIVALQDSGGPAQPGRNLSYESQNITLSVAPVNDAPVFAARDEILQLVRPASYLSVGLFVHKIAPGPANENCPYFSSTCQSQRVSFEILV